MSIDFGWTRPVPELVKLVEAEREARLASYAVIPRDIDEHAGIEARLREGGYRDRQIVEVVQNGVDAARQAPGGGRVKVLLTDSALYVANNGSPLSRGGVESLLHSHLSDKRDDAIGRFGLGFKSLLGISREIAILSQSVSLLFNEGRAREAIGGRVSLRDGQRVPVTRLAWQVDGAEEVRRDPTARALAAWAVTIVRARLTDATARQRLARALVEFPKEFVLFAGGTLALELDAHDAASRRFTATPEGDRISLSEGETASTWRVIARTVKVVDEEAREDAGELHARDQYTLTWAVPDEGRERGRFWAWFPLQEVAPVPGVLNAPWKTNDDRSNVLRGAFNDALMGEMAKMIVESLPSLSTETDPAASIDYLPRRDVGSDAASRLAEAIWQRAARVPLVPDGNGTLRVAKIVRLHPEVSVQAAEAWLRLATEHRAEFVHPSAFKRERIRRVRELIAAPGTELPATTLGTWLELAAKPTLERVKGVLALVEELNQGKLSAADRATLRTAKIVLSATGQLAAASVTCHAPTGALPEGFFPAHPELMSENASRRVLVEILGIQEVSPDQWVSALARQFEEMFRSPYAWHQARKPSPEEWDRMWAAIRRAPRPAALRFLADRKLENPIRVRCVDGKWEVPWLVLRAGTIVNQDEAAHRENAPWVLDASFHREDETILVALHVRDVPTSNRHVSWLSETPPWQTYAANALSSYRKKLTREQRPQEHLLGLLSPESVPTPLVLLAKGSAPVRARAAQWVLDRIDTDLIPGEFGHESRRDAYPRVAVAHPMAELLEGHGLVEVKGRYLRIGDLLPFLDRKWIGALLGEALACRLRRVENGFPPECEAEPDGVTSLWADAFALMLDPAFGERDRWDLYDTAAALGHVPARVRAGGRELAIAEALVAEAHTFGGSSPPPDLPILVLGPAACAAFVARGAKGVDALAPPVFVPVEDALSPQEFEPLLGRLLSPSAPAGARIQRVTGLHRTLGEHVARMDTHCVGALLLVDVERLEARELASRGGAFACVCQAMEQVGWLSVSARDAKARYLSDDTPRRRAAVAAAGPRLSSRLLQAVGKRVATLKAALQPEVILLLNDRGASDLQVASVVLNSHGPNTLRELASALEQQGLQPPARWGTPAAAAFAESIGFPPAFGGSTEFRRDPVVDVEGPVPLGPLHDFQEEVRDELLPILAGEGRRRALVNLPTGAGKTRVAVQTLVQALCDGVIASPVLWVAQSDELCEQAVSCFREVWANFGAPRKPLRISRLWGGISRTLDGRPDPHVVVASIQTLINRFDTEGARWLAGAGAVVIDEAHHAVAKSYTALLRWLDRADRKDEPPIIGLTATAFRGFNELETDRLAKRFDGRLVPARQNPEALLLLLQDRGVLARVRFRPLESRVRVDFTEEELAHIERFSDIPDSALERLARNTDRNGLITRAVLDTPATTRILVFALSVRHARMLAADLTIRGRTAASIDAGTAPGTRRHLISAFRDGSIPVLVNYGVLTTGFDAPMTDIILIARPTFSPNLYQQMIGRGLRGKENGGKEVCDLVSIEDNFGRFGLRLAFHHFREMFNRSARAESASIGPGEGTDRAASSAD